MKNKIVLILALYGKNNQGVSYYKNLVNYIKIVHDQKIDVILVVNAEYEYNNNKSFIECGDYVKFGHYEECTWVYNRYKNIPHDKMIISCNRGYDVGPLLVGLKFCDNKYEYVHHIHSKSNYYWNELIQTIKHYDITRTDADTLVPDSFYSLVDKTDLNLKILNKYSNLFPRDTNEWRYPGGKMFITKTKLLKILIENFSQIYDLLTDVNKDDLFWKEVMSDKSVFDEYYTHYKTDIFNKSIDIDSHTMCKKLNAKNYFDLLRMGYRGIPDFQIEHAIERYIGYLICHKKDVINTKIHQNSVVNHKNKFILTNIPNFIINKDYASLSNQSADQFLEAVGFNSGNCMFWESTKKIIQNQTSNELIHFRTFEENKDKYIDKIDKVVFVLANSVWSGGYTQLNLFHNVIKDLNCKKYLFSIGAQNDTLDTQKFTEQEIVVYNKFFPCFEYFYLRGQYTSDLLKHNDIPLNNANVVGCPSILLKPIDTNEIKNKFKNVKKRANEEIKVGINFPNCYQHRKLYNSFENIMDDTDVFTLVVDVHMWYDFVNHGKKLDLKSGDALFKNRENFKFSNNVFELMNFFADKTDLMFGTRIHGTILGLCAGLPSMCIAIDSRTYELCEQMNIPYINCMNGSIDFKNKNELVNIFKNNFDVSKLDALRETINNNKKLYKI